MAEIKQCPVYKRCNGCQLQNMSYEEQLKFKEIKVKRAVGNYGKVEKIIGMKNPVNYRNKVQAVFRKDKRGNIISGIYQSSTSGIVVMDKCMLESEKADKIILTIRKLCKECKVTIYSSKNNYGFLKLVLVREGKISGEYMVVLVASTFIFPQKNIFLKKLLEIHPEIKTVVLNVNENEKMMLGKKEKVLFGDGYITDRLCGKYFRISPKSFYQVNHTQTEILYRKAVEFAEIKEGDIVLDAYCGIGTIGLIASDKAGKVIGVESNSSAVSDAKINARLNRAENIAFYCADAGKVMEEISENDEKIDVVFTDPPRAGCSRKFINSMLKLAPKKIVYVSCNPETLGRDLYHLTNGGYEAKKIQPVDMFPFTSHVECCVLLCREDII